MTDSHAHLHLKDFDSDRDDVFARMSEAGVWRVLEVGIDRAGASRAMAMAKARGNVLAAVGCHPHESATWDDDFAGAMRHWAARPGVVAFGEMGLDYYRDWAPRQVQATVFREQLLLARELDMPVIFHVRAAESDFLKIVDEVGPPRSAVLHAFSHSADFAAACLRRGFRLGIGGILTYPNSELPSILADVPPGRILLETDCPWLTPQPRRGKRNEPSLLVHVLQRLSEIYRLSAAEMDSLTDSSFDDFLGLD